MNIMTKRGAIDNIVTYEHYCDTINDLKNIPKDQTTLGSIAIVLKNEDDELEVFMATTGKEWIPLLNSGNGEETAATSGFSIHICSNNEYSSGVPTVIEPDVDTFYLIPASQESGNMYEEWIYVNNAWEKFGAGGNNIAQPNWNEFDNTASGYILNKPSIEKGSGSYSIQEGNSTTASGSSSHAEGWVTTASGEGAHAEGIQTTASQLGSHAEGYQTTSSGGGGSHSEGADTVASGVRSHAEGFGTIAAKDSQHVFGKFNIADTDTNGLYVEIVGNGTRVGITDTRSNARTLDWSGNEWLAGNLTAAGGSITIGSTSLTEQALQNLLSITLASGVSF